MFRLASIALWPHAVVYGTLLAGLLIGIWEWDNRALSKRWPENSRAALVLGVPAALVFVNYWGPAHVPYGVQVVSLLAMWYFLPPSFWNWLGSAAILMSTAVQSISIFGWSPRRRNMTR